MEIEIIRALTVDNDNRPKRTFGRNDTIWLKCDFRVTEISEPSRVEIEFTAKMYKRNGSRFWLFDRTSNPIWPPWTPEFTIRMEADIDQPHWWITTTPIQLPDEDPAPPDAYTASAIITRPVRHGVPQWGGFWDLSVTVRQVPTGGRFGFVTDAWETAQSAAQYQVNYNRLGGG